jgi:hypothetical protein
MRRATKNINNTNRINNEYKTIKYIKTIRHFKYIHQLSYTSTLTIPTPVIPYSHILFLYLFLHQSCTKFCIKFYAKTHFNPLLILALMYISILHINSARSYIKSPTNSFILSIRILTNLYAYILILTL